MFSLDVAQALRNHGVIRLKVYPTISHKIIEILLPLLSQHNPEQFKDYLVIVSEKRAKWIYTT
ncbi:MAG: hypothetical protein HY755_04730 [Nitrospirae bacterium]|nr:hypothetical protein [Nitrospirota bacterium]